MDSTEKQIYPPLPASPPVTGRTRSAERATLKAAHLRKLYRATPAIPAPVEGNLFPQRWLTKANPISRQMQRRLDRKAAKKEAGTAKRQARRDKKAAKRVPRPVETPNEPVE